MRPFIDQYEWKEISFPEEAKDWQKFETNSKTITLNVMFSPSNGQEIKQASISKHNSERETRAILLMTIDGKNWHYLAVRKLPKMLP